MQATRAALLGLIVLAPAVAPSGARAQSKIDATPPSLSQPTVRLGTGDGTAAQALPDLEIVSRRLDQARSQIQPNLGATRYDFGRSAIETLPQGDNAPLSQLLLQAPSVAQDSFGQLHVRGEHNDLQYRINGVQLPEGLTGFGASIQTRLAYSTSLITGALPAQYGFRTGAIVDIQTKTGTNSPGASVSLYGGSRNYAQPSFEYGGRSGPVDWFVTGEYLHSNIGIENSTNSFNARHDETNQFRGFATVSGIVDDTTRISLIGGTFYGDFQIPTISGAQPGLGLTVNGVSSLDGSQVRQRQRESSQFGILSLQKHLETIDVQTSIFARESNLQYSPDLLGDLLFNGNAQNARRQSTAGGVQTDASWKVSPTHTLRAGFLAQIERSIGKSNSLVLPVDDSGAQTTDQPFNVVDNSARTGGIYGVYLQDEWKILPTVTINYGGQYDIVDEYAHDSQFSPRVNVVWTPREGTVLHAGYSRYFQTPPFELVSNTSVSRFEGTTAAPAVTANGNVRSEKSDYYDVGASQTVIPGLVVGVDAYFKQARNQIDEGQFGAPIVLTPFNYDRGEIGGVELTGSYDRGPLSLYANLAYSRAIGKKITSSQFNFSPDDLAYIGQHYIYLDHDQRWTGSAGAAYTLFGGTPHPLRASADLVVGNGLRAGAPGVPNGRELGEYYVFNASLVQRLNVGIGKQTELRLDVLNLFDRTYTIRDGSGVGVGNPQYGLRRAVLAGVTQRF